MAPAGTLRLLPVPVALRRHVAHGLEYREHFPEHHDVWERVLPDGAVRLIFHLASPVGGGGAAPSALIVGASTAPAMVPLRGEMHGLSLTLQPGATMALFGLPAGELTGRSVPLRDLLGPEGAAFSEQVLAAPDASSCAAELWASLLRGLRTGRAQEGTPVLPAIERITAAGDRASVRDVAESMGVGERRLQQLFHDQVGLSPRAVGRLARLHHLLRTLRQQPGTKWAELAADCGFYDQSHLVSEFRSLCGLTPTEFARRTTSGSSKTSS